MIASPGSKSQDRPSADEPVIKIVVQHIIVNGLLSGLGIITKHYGIAGSLFTTSK